MKKLHPLALTMIAGFIIALAVVLAEIILISFKKTKT
jgi:hypothetical protein